MSQSAYAQKMCDASVRVERCIWINGAIADLDSQPDDFEDFCEDIQPERDTELLSHIPCLKSFLAEEPCAPPTEVAEVLAINGIGGFLVQAASPVRRYIKDSSSFYSGWGHYRTKWFYGKTIEAAADQAIEWAERMGDLDKDEAKP